MKQNNATKKSVTNGVKNAAKKTAKVVEEPKKATRKTKATEQPQKNPKYTRAQRATMFVDYAKMMLMSNMTDEQFEAMLTRLKKAFNEKTEEPKKIEAKAEKMTKAERVEKPKDEFGKMYQGVAQVMSVTAKLRKEIVIAKYSEICYTLKAPKSLHDLLTEFKLSWSHRYGCWWLPQSKVEKVAKKLGVKIA